MNDEQLEAKATSIAEQLAAEMAEAEAKYGKVDAELWRLRRNLNTFFKLLDQGAPTVLLNENRNMLAKGMAELAEKLSGGT